MAEVGDYFRAGLRALQTMYPTLITDVRGLGLMIGVEIADLATAKSFLCGMMDRYIVINRTHETVLRFLPPYLITTEHVDRAIGALDSLCREALEHQLPAQSTPANAPVPEGVANV